MSDVKLVKYAKMVAVGDIPRRCISRTIDAYKNCTNYNYAGPIARLFPWQQQRTYIAFVHVQWCLHWSVA